MDEADQWIRVLDLRPHPEGGWFRELYRAGETIPHAGLPGRFTGLRSFSTAIYYLLKETDFSALHRIQQDEVWHFYDGASVTIHQIDATGSYSSVRVGRNHEAGESLVAVVEAGWLFGAMVNVEDGKGSPDWALVGCTVAPGFEFADFEMPSREQLLRQYPQHRRIIEQLTR